ncbi:MAG: glycosyltransferase family 1 protein [Patescibacteria group bacterium]|nr:glycosyltransferase family 1 protein [Patescibacteria group bacterium]
MELKQAGKPKRIGIDARFYGPQVKGLGRYTQEVVSGVIANDQINEYVIFLNKDSFTNFACSNKRVTKVLANARWYTLKEQALMPFLFWRAKLDLIHVPHFNVPLLIPQKFIVTIHDLILTKYSTARATTLGPFLYKIKNIAYKFVIYLAVKRARRIIAVSEFTKNDLIKQFELKPEKVATIYEGISSRLIDASSRDDKEVILGYNIHKPYLLYVGNAYPHKNLEGLIKVFPKIKEKNPELSLVLVGKEDYFYARLKQLAQDNENADNIIFPGFVPDNDLAALFRQAEVYVFPSYFEGFGLPPLEAMRYGCVAVSSNRTCLPEVLGDAAIYFDPGNEQEFIGQIDRAINDSTLRSTLRGKGYEQIKRYSWQKCAQETLAIYNAIN